MSTAPRRITAADAPARPGAGRAAPGLKPGDRIRITQTVRVGARTWPAEAAGGVPRRQLPGHRGHDRPRAGGRHRRADVHFTKDNGELSSVALDENTKIEGLIHFRRQT